MYGRESKRKELPMSPPNHDEAIQQLLADFRKGYLTRRGFLAQAAAFGLTAAAAVGLMGAPTTQKRAVAQDSPPDVTPKKWEKGKGWGWVWGEYDELGRGRRAGQPQRAEPQAGPQGTLESTGRQRLRPRSG